MSSPPLRATRSSEIGSCGAFRTSDWIALVVDQRGLGLDLHVHAAAQVEQQPGQGGAGLLDQVDRALQLLGEERALRRRAAELGVVGTRVGVGLRLRAGLVGGVVGVQLDRERDLVAALCRRPGACVILMTPAHGVLKPVLPAVPDLERDRRPERDRVAADRAEPVGAGPSVNVVLLVAGRVAGRDVRAARRRVADVVVRRRRSGRTTARAPGGRCRTAHDGSRFDVASGCLSGRSPRRRAA